MNTTTWLDAPVLPLVRTVALPTGALTLGSEPEGELQPTGGTTIYPDGVVGLITSAAGLGRSITEAFASREASSPALAA